MKRFLPLLIILSTHRSPGRMRRYPAATNHTHPAGIMLSASHFQLPSLLR